MSIQKINLGAFGKYQVRPSFKGETETPDGGAKKSKAEEISDKITTVHQKNPMLYVINPTQAMIDQMGNHVSPSISEIKSPDKSSKSKVEQMSDSITDFYQKNPIFYVVNPTQAMIDQISYNVENIQQKKEQ